MKSKKEEAAFDVAFAERFDVVLSDRDLTPVAPPAYPEYLGTTLIGGPAPDACPVGDHPRDRYGNASGPIPLRDQVYSATVTAQKQGKILEPKRQDLKPQPFGHTHPKAPMQSLPLGELEGLARVLEYGNRKYAQDNWVGTADDPMRYIGALLRHLGEIRASRFIDSESGLPHSWHVQACALILDHALRRSGAYKWEPLDKQPAPVRF